jgi:lauroyl/myristoyl acyltransferase
VVHRPLDATRSGSFRADVQRLTQELATIFEHDILQHPEQWHLYQPNWPSDRQQAGDREDRQADA